MSVRTELEELVKWISELMDKEEPKKPEPLDRETWGAIERNLQSVAGTLGEAADALAGIGENVSTEFARDLQGQANGLAFRAHMLSRRAKPKEPDGTKPSAAQGTDEAAARRVEAKARQVPDAPRKHEARAPRTAADLVRSAGNTIDTAYKKLGPSEEHDVTTDTFEAELDVLAEMTLSLRQQCERLEGGRKPPERPADA